MTTSRTFAAIDISEEARTQVAAYISRLRSEFKERRVGWERPEKLHITVKFFGDVESGKIAAIQERLERIASGHSAFTAELAGTGVFPNPRNPRVLWIGIQNDDESMTTLGREIEAASRELGLSPEQRRFSPHLTIARLRDPEKSRDLAETHLNSGFAAVRFEVGEIALYESKLQPSGSIYRVLSRFVLA
jgi:RNA 2',3'-cyclic 3'-phosphodiesterase